LNSMYRMVFGALVLLMAVWLAPAARAQDWLTPPTPAEGNPPANAGATLFQNVRIFDGRGASLSAPSNVLIRGNIIERISTAPIAAEPGATVIAGNGRTLMPGLIDAHWHAMLIRPNPAQAIFGDVGYNNIEAGVEATDTLMRGFTTVRDVGGPAFGLKKAIDSGLIAGPRIFPSGAVITVTSGHGDFRQFYELPRTLGGPPSRMEETGGSMVADSPDEVRVRVREQLMRRLPDQANGRRRCFLAVQPDRRVDFHGAGIAGGC
jgi:imidazolonepropionase-like amidohydrolase